MVFKTRAGRREARKHEAAVLRHTRHRSETELLLAEFRRTPLRDRHADQGAVGVETPAVIEAGQPRRMAAALVGDFCAAMAAAVEQHMDAAVAMPRHHHRLPPEFGGKKIARIGDLAGMADEQPGPAENPLHLQFEDIRIGIDAPVDASRLDQFCDRSGVPIHHGAFRCSGGRAAARCVFTRACWYRSARAATASVIPESAKPWAHGPTAADSSSRAMLWQTMGVQRRSRKHHAACRRCDRR